MRSGGWGWGGSGAEEVCVVRVSKGIESHLVLMNVLQIINSLVN